MLLASDGEGRIKGKKSISRRRNVLMEVFHARED